MQNRMPMEFPSDTRNFSAMIPHELKGNCIIIQKKHPMPMEQLQQTTNSIYFLAHTQYIRMHTLGYIVYTCI